MLDDLLGSDRRITHPHGAVLQQDMAPAQWIAGRLLAWGGDRGTRVCAIVPSGYEAYIRIFHHAEERVGNEWIRRRWKESPSGRGARCIRPSNLIASAGRIHRRREASTDSKRLP